MQAGAESGTRVCLLGPPAVAAGGAPLDLGGPSLRLVFTILALRWGEPVRAEEIADEVWGPSPQVDVAGALQRLLSRLRAAVSPAGLTITATPAGFVLAGTGPDRTSVEVDARRFDAELAQARALAADGDPERAAASYRAALSWWRGSALAGYAERPFARAEAVRLDEARLTATDELAATLLAARRPTEAAEVAEGLVAAAPFRESAWAHLMTALYRTGRQADALAAFRRCRTVLSDELGIEPGPEVRALEAQILTQSQRAGEVSMTESQEPEPRTEGRAGAAPTAAARHNLPAATARFIGRAAELAELDSLLREVRLLTLWGPGGAGKTRLSLEAAARALTDFPDGLWLAELAPLTGDEQVVPAVMAAVGIRTGAPEDGSAEALCRYLSGRQALVILDNCEHVVGGAARAAHQLLARCPGVRVLASSREPLGVPGECVWPTRSLTLPSAGATPGEMETCDAVAVFCERARRAHPGFALTAANAAAVAEICRRLDGLPLALELAAPRVRVLGVQALAERLDDSLRVLVGGPRTADPRHQTLAAAVEWSYDLLPPPEQAMLEALSVFPGTFDLAAAEAVGAPGAAVGFEGVDLLARLIDKSFVETVDDGRAVRYRMLETIRQYAAARLAATGGTAAVRRRHLDHFRSRDACDWRSRLTSDEDLFGAHQEQHNLRLALEFALAEKDADAAIRIVSGMWSYLMWMETPTNTPALWVAEALTLPGRTESVATAEILCAHSWFSGDPRHAEEALRMAERMDDPVARAYVTLYAGLGAGRPELRARAVELWGPAPGFIPGLAHFGIAWDALRRGDSRTGLQQAELAVARALPDLANLRTICLATLGFALALTGHADRAGPTAAEAVDTSRRCTFDPLSAMALVRATAVACLSERWETAEGYARELLPLLRRLGSRVWVGDALELAAVVLEATGRPGAGDVHRAARDHRAAHGEARGGGLPAILELVTASARRLGVSETDGLSLSVPDMDAMLLAAAAAFDDPSGPARLEEPGACLVRRGDTWTVGYGVATVHLKHAKGLDDLAALLASPGQDIHVLDLISADPAATKAEGRGAEVLDATALAAYRRRLAQLDDEEDAAATREDHARLHRIDAERAALQAELRAAAGLGGRTRPLGGDAAERARKAVHARLRAAVRRVADELPELGAHLERSLTTGLACRYGPAEPLTWRIDRRSGPGS